MGFRINTNVAAMNAHTNASMTNRNLDSSLAKLSSGLRINTAADDASGMAIADSLRSQASALGQAISNANDAIGIIQTADKAMDEQLKILDTIKVKATQAAQDGQSGESRAALQKDITRLLENLNNVAYTTTYNGQALLAGTFTNKEFQVGAYSNQSIKATIGATSADKIGQVRFETSTNNISAAAANVSVAFSASGKTFTMESVNIDISAGSGIGALANVINKNANYTGVRATYLVQTQASSAILSADIGGLAINGITIGAVSGILPNDADGRLIAAINKVKDQTGVEAFVDTVGRLNLKSNDGRGISMAATAGLSDAGFLAATSTNGSDNMGRLTLIRLDSRDIIVSNATGDIGFSAVGGPNSTVLNLQNAGANITSTQALALGVAVNSTAAAAIALSGGIGAAVTSLRGAMAVMDIAESAQKMLDTIRADLGSVQNQLTSTINNISITQVNVRAAESNIRDVDFAAESATFAKNNILAQSGSYAMSQANAIQQTVLKLLQ